MKNPVASIKTLVLLSTIAFAGHVLATDWFSGTANNSDFDLFNATTNHPAEGVEIANDALSIDLPTGQVFQITPSDSTAGENNGKTFVDVSAAVFTPTAYEDIDNSVVVGAQTALTVAYDANNATNYYAYITNNWVKLSGAVPVATPVAVTIELDYSVAAQTNATFKVGGEKLHDEFNNDTFPISGSQRALGHVELAGYGSIHSITSTVEAVANVTVTPGTVTYGADFTNVTITATLGGTGYESAEYSLTWNGSPAGTFIRDGNTITITAPIGFPSTVRDSVEYVINVNGNAATNQTTVVADNRAWVTEDVDHYEHTGTWSNDFLYVESRAPVSDNTYTASSCTTGDLVTITFENLVYTEFSDLTVETPEGTQGAFALAETNINNQVSTNFCVLAMENNAYTWKAATCTGVAINTNIEYTVVMAFNYVNNTYSVSVSDGTNTGDLSVNSSSAFPLCVSKASVKDFVFKGSGKLEAIKGVDSLGYMAKDSAGHWYATIDEATKSGGREFIVLRDTDPAAPAGWKFVKKGGITKLVKVAKGMFFMAY